ncbi:MAG: LacI family DNA-binding transcriptional regulator [Victivallales bacterium]|nr:LacI family DNA-binding transcriptional regulator [Victivallales bacterium]
MTQKEIAQKLNITQAAVSMALKNSPRISQATRDSVQALAEQMGYVPNLASQMLRQRRTNVIGAVFPRLTNPFFAELFQEIQRSLLPQGYMLYLAPAKTEEEVAKVVSTLRQMGVAGVIGFAAEGLPSLLELQKQGTALVLYGGDVKLNKKVSQVLPDRYAATRKLMKLFFERGRKHIAQIGSSPIDPRYQAYVDSMKEHHLPVVPISLPKHFTNRLEAAYDATVQHLREHPECDAIFAHNDEVAFAVHRAIRMCGKSVPDDISLAGFDATSAGAFYYPALTSVEQPCKAIADAILQELLATIQDKSHAQFISIPCRVIQRESI